MRKTEPIRFIHSLRRALLSLLLVPLASAHAHQVWIEQDDKGAALFFGEFAENLRETSPGLLDKFVKPKALRITGTATEAVTLVKKANAFELSARIPAGQSLVAEETGYPFSERKDGDKTVRTLYHPAARLVLDWTAQAPRLKLDLVPTGRSDNASHELRATFNGQALPKAKVSLLTASGWSRELQTAEDGTVRVQLPWRGTYVLELSHNDATGGERDGQRFDRAAHVTSLTVVQHEGLPPLPARPPASPNKMN